MITEPKPLIMLAAVLKEYWLSWYMHGDIEIAEKHVFKASGSKGISDIH